MAEPSTAAPHWERLVPWIAGVVVALPVALFRYPPMMDLPMHEASVAVLRHFGDAGLFPAGLYVHNLGHTNQLFLLVAWALSYVVPVETSCKLVAAAVMIALPVAAGRFATHVGGSRWLALLVVPVQLGWLFLWGLLANLTGLVALLALLPTLDRFEEEPTLRRAPGVAAALLALFFAHGSALIVVSGAAFLFALGHPLDARRTIARVAPGIAGLAMCWLDVRRALGLGNATRHAMGDATAPLVDRIVALPAFLFGGLDPMLALSALSALAIALFALGGSREPAHQAGLAPFIRRHRFELLALGCLALYLVAPLNYTGTTLLYQRFIAPAYAIGAVCIARRGRAVPTRVARAMAAALPVAALAVALPMFAEVSRSARELDGLIAQMAPASAIAQLDLGGDDPGRLEFAPSIAARALVPKGGRLLFSFLESPIEPVMLARGREWTEPIVRVMKDPFDFRPAHDLTRFRYVIAYTQSELLAVGVAAALAPDARLVGTAGDWLLFESTLPVVPITSGDAPLPSPPPATLRERMQAAFDRLHVPMRATSPAGR